MANLDQIARRVAELVLVPVARIRRYTTVLLLVAAVIGIGSYLLGIAALDGSARTVWIVLGAIFGWLSIGRLAQQRWRVEQLYRNMSYLVDEVRELLDRELSTDPTVQQVIIEAEDDDEAAVIWTRQLMRYQGDTGQLPIGLRWIPLAFSTARRLPFVMLGSVFITGVFAMFAMIFLLRLALT
jgi:hypothetical protein